MIAVRADRIRLLVLSPVQMNHAPVPLVPDHRVLIVPALVHRQGPKVEILVLRPALALLLVVEPPVVPVLRPVRLMISRHPLPVHLLIPSQDDLLRAQAQVAVLPEDPDKKMNKL